MPVMKASAQDGSDGSDVPKIITNNTVGSPGHKKHTQEIKDKNDGTRIHAA